MSHCEEKQAPAVTVVIATYNYGRYLPGAIESVLAQSYRDFNIVVVDDGSTDNTLEVIQQYVREPCLTFHQSPHLGQPGAKNQGIRLATGRYIAFLDADDQWFPHKLERQMELFERDPELGVVYSRRQMMDPDGNPLPTPQPALYRGHVLEQMFFDNFVCFPSSVVRRDVFEDVGLFDETLEIAIDYDLWLRVACKYRFDYVDEPLLYYRTGHANLSSRKVERLHVALGIMDRFVGGQAGQSRLGNAAIRRAYASTWNHLGYHNRNLSRRDALRCYLQAVRYRPWDREAWYQMASLAFPESFRTTFRSGRRLLLGPKC